MDVLGQTALFLALTSFALGVSVLARNVKNKLYWAFAAMTSTVFAWAFFFAMHRLFPASGFYRWHLIANVWIAPVAIYFLHVLIRSQDTMSRRVRDLAWLGGASLSIALILDLDQQLIPPAAEIFNQAVMLAPTWVVLQILYLMLRRKVTVGVRRAMVGLGRRNWVFLGALLALATSAMDHFKPLGHVLPSIGNIFLIGYLFLLSQAITQQRFLNFAGLMSRLLVLLTLALMLAGVYAMSVAWIENAPGLFFLNLFFASFLILTLLDPLRRFMQFLTRYLLTQKHQTLLAQVDDARRDLTGVTDLGMLLSSLTETTEQFLAPEWVGVFLLRGDGTRFRRVRAVPEISDGDEERLQALLVDHEIIQACMELHRRGELPVLLDQVLENEIDRMVGKPERERLTGLIQALRALGGNVIIPLIAQEGGTKARALGFVVTAGLTPPEPWGNNWGLLRLIYPYFERVAQRLENLEVFSRQRERERLAALGEMSAGLAHEIRNPLGAIQGAVQMLQEAPSEQDPKLLSVIGQEVSRLNRVVSRFLDYSRPAASEFRLFDLSEVVEKTALVMKPSLPAGMELGVQNTSGEVMALGSPEQIQQVLVNLVQNAKQAMDARGWGKIQLSVGVDASGTATVQVEDNGPGIKRRDLERVFIPFFTTSPQGTGLGLSISQKIAQAHGGRIEVWSEPGEATRFTLHLQGGNA